MPKLLWGIMHNCAVQTRHSCGVFDDFTGQHGLWTLCENIGRPSCAKDGEKYWLVWVCFSTAIKSFQRCKTNPQVAHIFAPPQVWIAKGQLLPHLHLWPHLLLTPRIVVFRGLYPRDINFMGAKKWIKGLATFPWSTIHMLGPPFSHPGATASIKATSHGAAGCQWQGRNWRGDLWFTILMGWSPQKKGGNLPYIYI